MFEPQIPVDLRGFPKPLCTWAWAEDHLRVEDKVRKSVVFIGAETEHGFMPYGTGLLGIAISEDMGNSVVITAAHVVDSIPGDEVSIRINRIEGRAGTLKVKKQLKISFKDKAVDLVVLLVTIDPTIYDIYVIPLRVLDWNNLVEKYGTPGEGDEICVVGLYTTHFGQMRNMPIVRIGHIAAMPEEKVMTDRGGVHGWLIEAHSIAGLSGSPVFWNVPPVRFVEGKPQHLESGPVYLPIGILIGHHVIESKEDEIIVPQFQEPLETRTFDKEPGRSEERRTGFAVVLPIHHIFSIFESDEMRKILKEGAELSRKKSGYRPASAVPVLEVNLPSSDVNPNHREDFTSLLSAATRKREQER